MGEAYRTWIILLYQSTQLHAGATCFLIHQDVKVKRKVTEQQTLRLWGDNCGVCTRTGGLWEKSSTLIEAWTSTVWKSTLAVIAIFYAMHKARN